MILFYFFFSFHKLIVFFLFVSDSIMVLFHFRKGPAAGGSQKGKKKAKAPRYLFFLIIKHVINLYLEKHQQIKTVKMMLLLLLLLPLTRKPHREYS